MLGVRSLSPRKRISSLVIPAQAGIQLLALNQQQRLDSRLRGNDEQKTMASFA